MVYGEATEGGDIVASSPYQSRKRGRSSSSKNNNDSGSSNIHGKSSGRKEAALSSVDSLESNRNQNHIKRNLTNYGLDPLVDSNNTTTICNGNSINNINNNNNNNNNNSNHKTIVNTTQQHQKSSTTISDDYQLKTPTKKCNGIDENVNNYTAASSPPPSPKRVKTSVPLSSVKTRGRSNNTVTSHTFQSCGSILFGGLDAASPLYKGRISFPTSSNNSLYQDYVINAGQQESLDKFHSLAPGDPLHDIKMCRIMNEGLHDVNRIRNGEITGKREIIRAQTKYRNGIADAFPPAYRHLINQGTNNPDAHAMSVQNFATRNALTIQTSEDFEIHNLTVGACPRLLSRIFPSYIAHEITSVGGHGINLVESGMMNQQDVVSFGFDALSAADEVSRDTHHNNNMDEFCRAVGKGLNRFDAAAINTINIFFSGELCYSVHEVPMLLLLGTPKVTQYILDAELIGTDGCMTNRLNIVGEEIPHSQQFWDDFIKSNYEDDEKAQICAKLWRFYLPLLQKLDIGTNESITNVRTQLAFNWGKKMTAVEIKAKKEGRIEMAQRCRKAWAAFKAGTANDTQEKYVKSTYAYKYILGWEKWHEDPSALLQNLDLLVALVKSVAWKTHKKNLLVSIDEDSRSRVALIPTLEAAASAEVERRKAEKERIEAENEKKRLDSIKKELDSIKKIPDEERTRMHTIRLNFLLATLNENRPEQIHWRVEQAKEKKRLKEVKEKLQREEWGKELQELHSQTPSWDQEYAHQFRINLLTAQLQGRKEEIKRLKAEQTQLRKFQALEKKAEKKMKRKERERKAIEKKAEQERKRKEREDQSEFRGWSTLLEKEAIKYVKELKKKEQKIAPKKKKQLVKQRKPSASTKAKKKKKKKKPPFTPSISAPSHAACVLTPDVSICLDAYPPSVTSTAKKSAKEKKEKKPTFTPSISAPSHDGCVITPDVSICLDAYPPSATKKSKPTKKEEKNKYICPHCTKGFSSKQGLDYHISE